jgi:hypothetical protein
MIPQEVADLATLIWKDWDDLPEKDRNEVLGAAWRIYNAGWRKPQPIT